jgi:hypothetical protein
MPRHESPAWVKRSFGAIAVPTDFWLWNSQGRNIGLGPAQGKMNHRVAYGSPVIILPLVHLALIAEGAFGTVTERAID